MQGLAVIKYQVLERCVKDRTRGGRASYLLHTSSLDTYPAGTPKLTTSKSREKQPIGPPRGGVKDGPARTDITVTNYMEQRQCRTHRATAGEQHHTHTARKNPHREVCTETPSQVAKVQRPGSMEELRRENMHHPPELPQGQRNLQTKPPRPYHP